ncbi:peptidase families S8 and S53 domain protein [Verrucomicrobiia bacterium DG1235]|nr:peptidase families S8 and S53 domain protein [Verrucomicrobiae bacterium DG1235]
MVVDSKRVAFGMMKSKLPIIGFVALLAGLVVWLSVFERDSGLDTSQETLADLTVETGEAGGGSVAVGTVGISEYDGEGLAKAELSLNQFAELESEWSARYPEGELVGARVFQIGEGRYRRQLLVATGSERIPWVIWEDKIIDNADGVLELVGSVARMGDVFLIEARPEQLSSDQLASFMTEHDLFIERRSRVSEYVCLGFDEPELGKLEALIAAFETCFPGVLVEFDNLSYPTAFPSDWDSARMWGLDKINAPDAWEFATGEGAEEVVVAIVDTGVQTNHPDLSQNIYSNSRADDWDFVDGDSIPQDDDGHGTHVAGISGALGNNGAGAVGVNWKVKILPLKVGNEEGLRTSAINDALAYITLLSDTGVNIVASNNSYGSGGSNLSTRNEIAKHNDRGILFVAAAGNDGSNIDRSSDALEFPAGYTQSNIIAVASSNQEDTLNASSNYGTTSVDLAAPGNDIYSTYPTNDYSFLSGTSMASPMVAGAAALLASLEPSLTGPQIKKRLMDTADLLPSQQGLTVSGRRLNLLVALRPSLSGHELEVSNVADSMLIVDSLALRPRFETTAHASATVTASVVEGETVGQLESLGDGVFRFVPLSEGQASLRFTSTLEGITRVVDKTVFVGDAADVKAGLLHHFDFGGTGSSVEDLAGSSDGTLTGASRSNGEFGPSVDFDAVTESMSFDGTFSQKVTIAALVRSDNMIVSPHPRIVNMPFYYLYFSSGEGPGVPDGNRQTLKFFSNFTNFGVWNAPPRSVRDDQWYYVVGSYDSSQVSNSPELFINGEKQVVRMQQEPTGTMITTGGLSYVGNNDSDDRAFDGSMADIRVFNRELSAAEVARLGAFLMQDRWDEFEMEGPESTQFGSVVEYSIRNGSDFDTSLDVEWYVDDGSGASIIESEDTEVRLLFTEGGDYRVYAHVSDGVTTRVLSQQVSATMPSYYTGTTAGGGALLLEVNEDLNGGYLTVFDSASGFYRIREAVTLDEAGNFDTGDESIGRIRGTATAVLEGEIPGYAVSFSGEPSIGTSSISEFAGEYVGGIVGKAGERIRLRALADGRAYFWREGSSADLALSSVDIAGSIAGLGSYGSALEVTVDLESESVSGTWGEEKVFLKKAGSETDSGLLAGLVLGFPSGDGRLGMLAEFVEMGQEASDRLALGQFAESPTGVVERGPMVALQPNGKAVRIGGSGSSTPAARIAEMVDSGELDLGSASASGIRAQVPISVEGIGAIGFSIEGSEPMEVLARGLGRSFALGGAEDPVVSIYRLADGEAVLLSPNDDWRESAVFTGEGESAQGAFLALEQGFADLDLPALADDAKDAALRIWLEPGDYLVELKLESGTTGSGLIEVFGL